MHNFRLPAVLAGLVAAVVGQRLLQPMETRADAAAREHEPSPGAYARALARLYEANLTPVVLSGTTSHPSLFDRLATMPGVIIQGRYDVVTPLRSAWDLHKAWPKARLEIVNDAGHTGTEAGLAAALINATDMFS